MIMKKSKLQNTTTVDITGRLITPNLYTSNAGSFLPGDILDANSTMDKISETVQEAIDNQSGSSSDSSNTVKHAPTTDKTLANPGDVLFSIFNDNTGDQELLFVDPNAGIGGIMNHGATPIGIVVIPASHTQDGKVRLVSFAHMATDNTNGFMWMKDDEENSPQGIVWGDTSSVANPDTVSDQIVTYIPGTTTTSLVPYAEFATDYPDYAPIPSSDNPGLYYNIYTRFYNDFIPSPYKQDGTKNELWNTPGQVLVYNDGKALTDYLVNKSSWNVGDTINNSVSTNYYPAAFSCANYSVSDTSNDFAQGKWYLPSIAELGYWMASYKKIENAREKAGLHSCSNMGYWSSSECVQRDAWLVSALLRYAFGRTDRDDKGLDPSVLAFVAF